MSDLTPGTVLANRFRIEHVLGAGGMAIVYLAYDLRHDRKVALKVLTPELGSALGAQRFLREVRITAGLTHPHILPLLDSGEVPATESSVQLLYYVMPYAEGGTLRDRLREQRQLGIDEALGITRQVADALVYAHSRGVLHRDIKPENILFESGHAVVADFGIARAITEAGGEKLTVSGIALGTPAYMSPEQASADHSLDAQSDLYSLACVTYEMLVGEPPFTGPTAQAVLARRMTELPRPVRATRETVVPAVDAAVSRALARVPADRGSIGDFVSALHSAPTVATAGAPVAESPRRRRRSRSMAVAAAALLLVAAGMWAGRELLQKNAAAAGDAPRIAVMPFENLGGPDDEPFTSGITEEITGRLANISGLRVVSRTSARRFAGREMSMADLGKELTADYILEGTVRTDRTAGGTGTARVTPQLVRVADDVRIWQQSYDAALSPGDIFRVQAEIATRVAAGMRVTLGPQDRAHIAGIATQDSAAYRLYHLGRFHWQRRDDESLGRAEQYFRQAIARDSLFADAWAGLSTATLTRLISFRTGAGYADAKPAIEAARRAVQLDSLSATAHAALGYALMNAEWNWAGADSAFRKAIALDPEYGPAHYWYAQLWWLLERWSDALVEARAAIDVDPLSVIAHLAMARTLRLLGRIDEWLAENDRCIELQPEYPIPYIDLAEHEAKLNRESEAARNVRSYLSQLYAGRTIDEQTVTAVTGAAAGRADVSEIPRLLRRIGVVETPGQTARWFALSGARDSAFAYLQRAVSTRSLQLVTFVPHLGPLLGTDPRWADFRRSMRLP